MIAWNRLHRIASFSEQKLWMTLSLLIGLATGATAWFFIRTMEFFQFWPALPGTSHFWHWTLNRFWIVAIPTMGGLLCGLVVQFLAPSAGGTGTVDLMYALRRKESHVPWRHTLGKALASLFTVCSGAAAGPEGPVVSIGAGMASWLGERFGLEPLPLKSLVVAGAAAGFAAVFNAPIAGVLFATEVLLKEFTSQAFGMIVLATVTASVTTHLLLGNEVFVKVPPEYSFNHPAELFFYAILAVLSAILAKLFVQLYFYVEHQFERASSVPPAAKAMIGGLIVGLLALVIPNVLGNGHVEIPALITAEPLIPWTVGAMLLLLAGKMLACPVTVNSGGSGGIFIPYLLIGSLLGGLFGRGVHLVFPAAAPAGAYMLVGMGAVFSGITYAPFTAIILLFELTHDYSLILPLLFTVGITQMVARALDAESLDSRKLLRKGVRVHESVELRTLENYHVGQLMTHEVETIPAALPLPQITAFIAQHAHTGYPVVDEQGHPIGLLTYAELHQAFRSAAPSETAVAREMMRADFPTITPQEALTEAVRRMQAAETDRIIVIDPTTGRMMGILTRSDILKIYRTLLS